MSIFNPETFLQMEHTGQLDTKIPPVPVGEYTAQYASHKIRVTKSKDTGEIYYWHAIMWEILDDAVKAVTKMDHPQVRQEYGLDITPEGALDMSPAKNTRLGRVREACRMNYADRPFNLNMMIGSMARVKVGSRPNPNDPENPFSEVTAVTAI